MTPQVVHCLLGRGADINSVNISGNTPSHEAAGHQAEEIVRRLVDGGTAVNDRNVDGNTPLRIAVKSKADRSAPLLHGRAVNVSINNNTANDHTSLYQPGVTSTVHALSEGGAFLDLQNNDLETVLHDAVRYRRDDLVSYLLANAPKLCIVPVLVTDRADVAIARQSERRKALPLTYLYLTLTILKVKVKVIHILIVNFSPVVTYTANIAIANKYDVAYGPSIGIFTSDLSPF